jgi:hypothetical protein
VEAAIQLAELLEIGEVYPEEIREACSFSLSSQSVLFKMEPLGSRKPSELLSHMLEICPRGEEKNHFFIFLFLQQLSKELRSHLDDNERDSVKLAVEAYGTASGRFTAMSSTGRSMLWRRRPRTSPLPPFSRPTAKGVAFADSGPAGPEATAGVVPPPPSRSQWRTAPSTWPRHRPACASTTGTTVTRPGTASSPAVVETEAPGVPQRRHPWLPGPYCGPIV